MQTPYQVIPQDPKMQNNLGGHWPSIRSILTTGFLSLLDTYNWLSCNNCRWMPMKLWVFIQNPCHRLSKSRVRKVKFKLKKGQRVNIFFPGKDTLHIRFRNGKPVNWFPCLGQEHHCEFQWDRGSSEWKHQSNVPTHLYSFLMACTQSHLLLHHMEYWLQPSSMSLIEPEHSPHPGQPRYTFWKVPVLITNQWRFVSFPSRIKGHR